MRNIEGVRIAKELRNGVVSNSPQIQSPSPFKREGDKEGEVDKGLLEIMTPEQFRVWLKEG